MMRAMSSKIRPPVQRLRIRRRASDISLDLAFVTWAAYALISGHVVPTQLIDLFRDPAPITVVHEPADGLPAELPVDVDTAPEA